MWGAHHDDVCERVGARGLLRDLLQGHHVAPAAERVAAADRHDVGVLAAPPQLLREALPEGLGAVRDVLTLGNLLTPRPGVYAESSSAELGRQWPGGNARAHVTTQRVPPQQSRPTHSCIHHTR